MSIVYYGLYQLTSTFISWKKNFSRWVKVLNKSFSKLYLSCLLTKLYRKSQILNICNVSVSLLYIDFILTFSCEEGKWNGRDIVLKVLHGFIISWDWQCDVYLIPVTLTSSCYYLVCICVFACIWVSLIMRQNCCKNVPTEQILLKFWNFDHF